MQLESEAEKVALGLELLKNAGFIDLIVSSLDFFADKMDSISELLKAEATKCIA